ncbi:cysteine hydrolase [Cytobacillus spongiae]|jgi:nicotinamidase-related amidase|uniref:cysteine hydrolase family protein n=1 Tax=Cytobacillus spongiae TaxID=2901381 RepID=UPI001F2D111C|nr:isochorismatase family cysteine hydrolase [Cytobacillus spongiae]UII54298.1 cysteine hydrolase [Cytobacillus spongiae]
MNKALINIDYTIDFVTGALPCGEPAIRIEDQMCSLSEQFINEGNYVVFAIDLHHENDPFHPETKLYPPHNIEGTEGRNLYGRLKDVYEKHAKDKNVYWMDKTRYSAFSGTDLETKLRERHITELHLIGVCTDICVLHTAVDAYNKGFNIVVHENAVASFNQTGHEWALEHMKNCLNAEIK